jgi:hypothetical protein
VERLSRSGSDSEGKLRSADSNRLPIRAARNGWIHGGEAECMLAAQRDELGMIEGEVFCEITESPARRR